MASKNLDLPHHENQVCIVFVSEHGHSVVFSRGTLPSHTLKTKEKKAFKPQNLQKKK